MADLNLYSLLAGTPGLDSLDQLAPQTAPPAAAPPSAAASPINELLQMYLQHFRDQQAQQEATAAQHEAMRPHNMFQGALQAMAMNPSRESPLGDFLLSLLMGATGTPNPMTMEGRSPSQGKETETLPSPGGLASLARLAEGPGQAKAGRPIQTSEGWMTPEGKAIIGPSGQPLMPYHAPAKPSKPEKDPAVGSTPNIIYLDPEGKAASEADPEMPASAARAKGYVAVSPKTANQIESGRQALTMLNNMGQVFKTLEEKGKMIQAPRAGQEFTDILSRSLFGRVALTGQEFGGDPDLQLAAAQASEMIATQRTLGDKMRAMEAFHGALRIISTGRAPYSAVRKYFQQLDQTLRQGAPTQLPKVYDKLPGARDMPETIKRPGADLTPEERAVVEGHR